jgi:hypothetical protein
MGESSLKEGKKERRRRRRRRGTHVVESSGVSARTKPWAVRYLTASASDHIVVLTRT